MSQKYQQFTDVQRYQIEAYVKSGKSKEFIAKDLGVHRSTVYRELKRNATKRGSYSASKAEMFSRERKERFGKNRMFTGEKERVIRRYLEQEQWSPEQIVGYCKKQGIEMVSHERIYQYIRQDKAQGGGLYKHLRHRLKHRKRPVGRHMPIKDRVSIESRPKVVDEKSRFGDWEIDTIVGKANKDAIVTIVERTTSFFMMRKLHKGKNAKGLSKQLLDMLLPYKEYILTITSDNAGEFAEHKQIAKKLEAGFYFAHPYHSWERGLSEYTNKLIRQYIPKKTVLDSLDDRQIAEIQYKINRRPREKLNFETPKKQFFNLVS